MKLAKLTAVSAKYADKRAKPGLHLDKENNNLLFVFCSFINIFFVEVKIMIWSSSFQVKVPKSWGDFCCHGVMNHVIWRKKLPDFLGDAIESAVHCKGPTHLASKFPLPFTHRTSLQPLSQEMQPSPFMEPSQFMDQHGDGVHSRANGVHAPANVAAAVLHWALVSLGDAQNFWLIQKDVPISS